MRKRKPKLDFSSDRQRQRKRAKAFILAFSLFVILLGGASVLLFFQSIDYNFDNLVRKKTENTTQKEQEALSTVPTVQIRDANVLLTFYNADRELSGLYLISASAEQKNFSVQALDLNTLSAANGHTDSYKQHFKSGGMTGLKNAVEATTALKVDRYIKQSETNLKKTVGKIGNVTVNIPQPIRHKSGDLTLYLEAGAQNLTGDLYLKYLHYADFAEQENAVSALVQDTLRALSKQQNDTLLNYLFNASDTDFSIMDSAENGLITMFLSLKDSPKAQTP